MRYFKGFRVLVLMVILSSVFAQSQVRREKIDGVVAVVGDFIVLDSDIDLEYLQLKAQKVDISKITRCELLGKQLEDKLYAHQAIQDSILVSDAEISETMNYQIQLLIEQFGTMEKLIEFYKRKDEQEFRTYYYDIIKMNKLTSMMQQKVIESVEITPEEVRNFYHSIPEDQVPTFGPEVEVAQIVIKPKVSELEKQKVIDKLNSIKQDVLSGRSTFFTKAVLNSEDPGTVSNGGYYKISRKTPFVKEFKDVAFSLDEGEISDPFETEFGFHIILVEKIKGQELELRHILIKPKPSADELQKAKDRIAIIREKILDGSLTFKQAAISESEEKETKQSGGVLLNPQTMDPKFELAKMDPSLYSQIVNLKQGEISEPILEVNKSNTQQYKIITVNKKTDEHLADFSEDFMKIKDLALKDKQLKAIAKWTEEKISETYIKITQEYKSCDFLNNWVKI